MLSHGSKSMFFSIRIPPPIHTHIQHTTTTDDKQAMSTPTGRPPPSPRGHLASPRVGGIESKHTPMHAAAEQGRLEEMRKTAAHDPSSVASKGHMGVSVCIYVCTWVVWREGRERGNEVID